jgi:hypothetical protein
MSGAGEVRAVVMVGFGGGLVGALRAVLDGCRGRRWMAVVRCCAQRDTVLLRMMYAGRRMLRLAFRCPWDEREM